MKRNTSTERGQAYTLEGFIGAMIVLMAILFALQSVVIMPTTGGSVDRTVQAQMQQEVQDSLVVAATNESQNLSYMARYWNEEGEFHEANQSDSSQESDVYDVDAFREFTLGQILHDRFTESGRNYNVELHYMTDTERNQTRLVYQGSPSSNAVTASYTVTLYDNQTVTSPESNRPPGDGTLDGTSEDRRAIPQADPDDTPLYNVVEVRVIVW